MLQFQTSLLTPARDHHVAHSGSQLNDRDVGPRFLFDVVHSTRYTLDDLFVALAEEWRRSREEDVEDYTHGPHVAELVVFTVDLRLHWIALRPTSCLNSRISIQKTISYVATYLKE